MNIMGKENQKNSVIITELPRVRMSSAAGGTRTSIKTNRPFQRELVVNPTTCPFCKEERRATGERPPFQTKENLIYLRNEFTPFTYHRMIVPYNCFDREKLYSLGGKDNIRDILLTAKYFIEKDFKDFIERKDNKALTTRIADYWLGIHVGWLAGQNVCHLHCHVLNPIVQPKLRTPPKEIINLIKPKNEKLAVYESKRLKAVVGGFRAGEICILPKTLLEKSLNVNEETSEELAHTLSYIISLVGEKFASPNPEKKQESEPEYIPPHYMIGLRFTKDSFKFKFIEGFYIPILNNWGFTEYFALRYGTPIILPWPHEITAAYLRGEITLNA